MQFKVLITFFIVAIAAAHCAPRYPGSGLGSYAGGARGSSDNSLGKSSYPAPLPVRFDSSAPNNYGQNYAPNYYPYNIQHQQQGVFRPNGFGFNQGYNG